jgi:hypothetical protein
MMDMSSRSERRYSLMSQDSGWTGKAVGAGGEIIEQVENGKNKT